MIIDKLEVLSCDAGWRNYNFLKLTTKNGIVGWSEFDEAYGPPGVRHLIEAYASQVIGSTVLEHERLYSRLAATIKPAPYGLTGEALGAIENAILDAKAKALGVPCYALLGGKQRDAIPVYWSHCATWRINHPNFYTPAIKTLDDVRRAGEDAYKAGYKAVKTNLFVHGDGPVRQWMAGFGAPNEPGLNFSPQLIRSIRAHLEALRDGLGPDMQLMVDLNFNARTEGYVSLINHLRDFDFLWVELDIYNPEALAYIRQRSHSPVASLETLFGIKQFLPYLNNQSVDVAIIDAVWNGVWQSMKMAHVADTFDVNIAPHNFYSHLATMMNVHFAAAVPNLRIMETDGDRLPWDSEIVTHPPIMDNGAIIVPDAPGWGCEPNESALLKYPPKTRSGYLGL